MISFKASAVNSVVIGFPNNCEYASKRVNAPSNSRILDQFDLLYNFKVSGGISNFSSSIFFCKIAVEFHNLVA